MIVERKTYTFDATDKILGRLASEISVLLQGKNRPDYQPQADCGHFVEVKNVGKIKVTGHKATTKDYKHFSGYPGGMKTFFYKDLIIQKPTEILRLAVMRMLPKNKLRKNMIKRLKFIK